MMSNMIEALIMEMKRYIKKAVNYDKLRPVTQGKEKKSGCLL